MRKFASSACPILASLLLTGFAILLPALASQDPYEPVQPYLGTCFGCHGENGQSTTPQYPILAGQEFYYLYVQLKDFKSGLRAGPIMGPIVSGIERSELKLMAQYFAEQSWPDSPTGVAEEDKRKARASITAGQCVACHLSGFEGNSRVPRARGQHAAYLKKTLLDFKTKARNNSPSKSSLMASMSDEEIAAVAAYLAGMETP